jgi:hypothetical protein
MFERNPSTDNRVTPSETGVGSHRFWRLNRFVSQVRANIKKRAPLGYEDETGFHFGARPSKAAKAVSPCLPWTTDENGGPDESGFGSPWLGAATQLSPNPPPENEQRL